MPKLKAGMGLYGLCKTCENRYLCGRMSVTECVRYVKDDTTTPGEPESDMVKKAISYGVDIASRVSLPPLHRDK